MDWQQAQKELVIQLIPLYGDREAAAITDWVMENLSGRKKIDRLIHRSDPLSPATNETFHIYLRELLTHRPVQYVLHESWFAGMKLYVDESVLIPRPETEELVDWIVSTIGPANPVAPQPSPTIGPTSPTIPHSSNPANPQPLSTISRGSQAIILDVGTGSGCIALALARHLPTAKVHACDLSPKALAVARRNAETHHLPLTFHKLDFLDPKTWSALPPITTLVSNPPYIPQRESLNMAPHVVNFEPNMALFVPNDDALVFYRALSHFAKEKMPPNSQLFVEIHEEMGQPVLDLFLQTGLKDIVLRRDLQGKDRMIKATT